jgi:iron(III) transport system substrate-binding protein
MKKIAALLMLLMFVPDSVAQTAGWQPTWEETLAAAKKEGKVTVSGPPSQELRRALPAAFKERFGITLEYLGGRSSETAIKLRVERQAGVHTVDVMIAGIQTMATILYPEKMLDPVRPVLVLPEVIDASKWKKRKLWFSDPEDQFVLRISNTITMAFYINTREVKTSELSSIRDLLGTRWRGKISLQDPTVPGSGSNQAAHLYVLFGEDFIRKLYIDQRPMISRDTRQLTDWLARGTYPITLGAEEAQVEQLRKEGLPISPLTSLADLPEAISGGFGQVALLSRAPHPNAARIFVNWMASRQGSEIFARAMGVAPTRNDIDESFLPPEIIPRAGVNYFDTFEWNFTVTTKEEIRFRMKELLRAR